MKVRITFRSEIVLEGNDLEDVANKWSGIPLFSDEATANGAEFIELVSVEDADTCKDLMVELNKA